MPRTRRPRYYDDQGYGNYDQNPWDYRPNDSDPFDQRDGGFVPPDPVTPDPVPAPTVPDYSQWGSYRPEGLDPNKVTSGHASPKYQIARVLSNFDPTKGITPEVLAALNALGIGTFGGSRDQLTVGGNVDPRFEGVTGADVVRNFTSDGTGTTAWLGWGGNNPTGPGVRTAPQAPAPLVAPLAPSRFVAPTPSPVSTTPTTPDPFAAIGGGVFVDGGWVPKDHPVAQAYLQQQATAQQQATVVPSTSREPINTAPAALRQELWETLINRARQGLDVDRTNPAVRGQADAYSAQEERARRNFLGDVAERSSPFGTGATLGQERISAERMGQRVGGFEAELVGREIAARRDEIASALQQMQGLLSSEQEQALRRELAGMDAELKRMALSSSDSQFFAQLAQRGSEFGQDLGFRYAGLEQAGDQFTRDLGFRVEDQASYWDAVRRGLL